MKMPSLTPCTLTIAGSYWNHSVGVESIFQVGSKGIVDVCFQFSQASSFPLFLSCSTQQ